MDIIIPLLLILLVVGVAALIYFNVTQKNSGSVGANQDLLVEDLRAQVKSLQLNLQKEQGEKTGALQRAASAEALATSAKQQLTEAQTTHATNLTQLRADYAKNIDELKVAFSKMSTDVLKGMTPDVTREVANNVSPLFAQVHAALESHRKTVQQSMLGQDQAIAAVSAKMSQMSEATNLLASSTNDFTAVLKSSQHRGQWGEQTLKNVVDSAKMSSHCDYRAQVTVDDSRPDLIIRIPGNRCVIIDSKAPEIDAEFANHGAVNRREVVEDYAKKLLKTIKLLADKDYAAKDYDGLKPFPQIILFLPAESLLSTALEGDNDLIIKANKLNILIATPATLLGFLGAISLTWQQHQQSENATKIVNEANEFYKRVSTLVGHISKARNGLHSTVENFNKALRSYDTRVRTQGEELRKLGVAGESLESIPEADTNLERPEGQPE